MSEEDGISQDAFRTELEKYEVVRGKDFQGEPLSPVKKNLCSAKTRTMTPANAAITSIKDKSSTEILPVTGKKEEADVWDLLHYTLRRNLPEETAAAVLANCRKQHADYICSLSYDDMEKLAAFF